MKRILKLKKLIIQTASVFTLFFFILSNPVYAENKTLETSITESFSEIQPHSDIIDWRYKTVGNKLYRRLYNFTKGEWAMDYWELCP